MMAFTVKLPSVQKDGCSVNSDNSSDTIENQNLSNIIITAEKQQRYVELTR